MGRIREFGKGLGWYDASQPSHVVRCGESAINVKFGQLSGYKLTVYLFTRACAWARKRLAACLPDEQRRIFTSDQGLIVLLQLEPPNVQNLLRGDKVPSLADRFGGDSAGWAAPAAPGPYAGGGAAGGPQLAGGRAMHRDRAGEAWRDHQLSSAAGSSSGSGGGCP
ncbi:hypothetical protein GPECTOR_340g78 [Gonium pectorale]|uniref:Uncharacterized protein n=1 Tax=Gonium pectorale TaxID=33097 RepID=A0A150FWR9_GONPE|nr:hypothetical protein GPECTOR_340g78 [Gonium pectorale]|eukprot:KXZ41655.1 hypothetical protein GPECTOR_340g78 [Gonium pectorale]